METVLTNPEIDQYCVKLTNQIQPSNYIFRNIYAIPMGAFPVAIRLSKLLELPIIFDESEISKDTLVVDDIADTGNTLSKYAGNCGGCAVLITKKRTKVLPNFTAFVDNKDIWWKFPWEGETTIDQNIVRVLEYIGEDPNREGLKDTPRRVIKAYDHLFSGYSKDPSSVFTTFSSEEYDEMVLLKNVELYSMCEHHILPFVGKAHVAYIPNKKIIGISKLARLVEIFSRRLQIQERIGNQITSALMDNLEPIGAACIIEAQHLCMQARGVEKQNSIMVTSSLRGVFKENPAAREELMRLIK